MVIAQNDDLLHCSMQQSVLFGIIFLTQLFSHAMAELEHGCSSATLPFLQNNLIIIDNLTLTFQLQPVCCITAER